jgi:DNA-binding transcriptional regulator LsrR (DeoR family)
VEIGASYQISRFQVARLLTEALEKGIVEIKVHFPSRVSAADIRRIESALGISQVVVADTNGDVIQARGILAKAAAVEISRQAPAGGTMGISWSRTLDVASRLVRDLPGATSSSLPAPSPRKGRAIPSS